jgi:hypothetical protein
VFRFHAKEAISNNKSVRSKAALPLKDFNLTQK